MKRIKRINGKSEKIIMVLMALLVLFVPVLDVCAVADASQEPVENTIALFNFNDAEAIGKTGAVINTKYVKDSNKYCAYWGDHNKTTKLNFAPSVKDWSEYDYIEMDIYSETATNNTYNFVIETEEGTTSGYTYYRIADTYDWSGWKKFKLYLNDFSEGRTPSWEKVTNITFQSKAWGTTPDAGTKIYIASMYLKKFDSEEIRFDNESSISAGGATASTEYTSDGNEYSMYWNNQTTLKNVYYSGIPKDWTGYDYVEIDMYSKKATGTEFAFIVETEEYPEGSWNYFIQKLKYDWEGQKTVTIKLADMSANRNAAWDKVSRLNFASSGWSMTASQDAEIYITSIRLKSNEGLSLLEIYSEETISAAKEAMTDAIALYGERNQVLGKGCEVNTINSGSGTIMVDDTLLAPASVFEDELGAEIVFDETEWLIELSGKKLNGTVGEKIYSLDGAEYSFEIEPRLINGELYFPAEELAIAAGKNTVTDGKLLIIGDNNDIDIFKRISGVNEYTEVVAYLAAHIPIEMDALSAEDCAEVKANWKYELVGSESNNDLTDENIKSKIADIGKTGQKAWDAINKEEGATELFTDIATTTTSNMTATYNKIEQMALAYATYGSDLFGNEDLKADILYSLEWMYQNRYGEDERLGTGWKSTSEYNWWDWKIGTPEHMINTLIIMEDYLSEEQIRSYLSLFDYLVPYYHDVGSNALETGRLAIGSALLKNDCKKVVRIQAMLDSIFLYVDNNRNTASQLYGDRCEDRGQGFYTDGSYLYHTLHAMNGVYGIEQFRSTGRYLSLFAGTKFEITNPQADNVADWIYEAFEPLVYQGAIFRMVKGRSPGGLHTAGLQIVDGMLATLPSLSESDQIQVKQIIKKTVQDDKSRNFYTSLDLVQSIRLKEMMSDDTIEPKAEYKINKIYYNEDKVVHQRDDFAMGISMSSSRVFNYESINNQNMTGWYVSDGMIEYRVKNDFTQSNNKYWANIDPYKLPGTTVDTQERQAVSIAQGNEYLSSKDFVGGASDGTYGVASMWLESYHNEEDYGADKGSYGGKAPAHNCDLQAKKSYFMFDDEVVCLGSDINASTGYNVLTIVDNRRATKTQKITNGSETVTIGADTVTVDGEACEITDADKSIEDVQWVHLEKTGGYYFPQGESLFGKYTASANSFFELWIDHGVNPSGGAYAYVMLPGKSAEETGSYVQNPDIEILENTPSLQVVKEKTLGITQMVFWEAGTYGDITVDAPMSLMVEEKDGKRKITVSDPTRKLSNANITVEGVWIEEASDEKVSVLSADNTKLTIDFEDSDGRSMEVVLNKIDASGKNMVILQGGMTQDGQIAVGDEVYVTAVIKKSEGDILNANAYVVFYDVSNRLIGVEGHNISVNESEGITTFSKTIPENTTLIKAFVWEMGEQSYLTEAVCIK